MASFSEWAVDRRFKGLVWVVLALVAVALVAYTYLTIREARYVYSGPTTISVRGLGEVTRMPDVATFSFTVHAETDTPEAAQAQSAEAANMILAYRGEAGIPENDIKTVHYNLSPRYEYPRTNCTPTFCPPSNPTLVGYSVDQTVEVKVRDTEQAGTLIAGVGERGATNVSGLTFTVDDDDAAKADARAQAVADAKAKAETLADTLGVRLVRLTGFWEEEQYYPMAERAYGGMMMDAASAAAPQLPSGENTITSVVNLTYEIR